MKRKASDATPLTPAVFYILLSLNIKERHGYEIMKQVKDDSKGKVKMGPGTLYGSIKRMLMDKLILESEERPDPKLDDERRRYYQITTLGRQVLNAELERFSQALSIARKAKLSYG